MTTSTDPEQTSGKAAEAASSHSFPVGETLPVGLRMTFQKYERFSQADNPDGTTTAVISLPLPQSISDRSGVNTGQMDLGALGAADLTTLNKAVQSWEGGLNDLAAAGQGWLSNEIRVAEENMKISMLRALALTPKYPDLGGPIPSQQALQLQAGVIRNPHTNTIFSGVDLKSFQFMWRLQPRSQQESDVIRDICRQIKIRMHPEESFQGLALDYPDTVEIEFIGDVANYLPKFRRGIIRNFDVNYGRGDGISLFKSWAPSEVEISIGVVELQVITRNILEDEEPVG